MSLPPIANIPARWHGPARGKGPVKWVVLHTAETGERGNSAESVANYFKGGTAKASAHYCVDNDSIVRCVQEADVAWAAPGANANGIQIEMAGRAAQTAQEWADVYSLAELDLCAHLVADICARHRVPIAWRRASDLLKGLPGITTHAEVNKAWHKSTHTDPGPNFPASWFITRAQSWALRL